jgi:hypothetical protein
MFALPAEPVTIPRGLPAAIRRIVVETYEAHGHLGPDQLAGVIQYAQARARLQQVEERLDADGIMLDTEKGPIKHPLIVEVPKLSALVLNLARSLSLPTASKAEKLDRAAQKAKGQTPVIRGARKATAAGNVVHIPAALRDVI